MGHWWPLVYLGIVGQAFSALLNCLPFSHSVMSDSVIPMDCIMTGFAVLHCLLEFAQIYVHWVGDAIQPSHPLWPPSPLACNLPQHQGLFQWVAEFLVGYFFLSLPRGWTGDILINLSSTKYSTAETARKSNQSILKEINPEYSLEGLMLKLKLPSTWPPDVNSQPIGKEIDAGKDWGQKEMGVTECETVGWHHWLNGREFSVPDYPGDTEGQGSLACCRSMGL